MILLSRESYRLSQMRVNEEKGTVLLQPWSEEIALTYRTGSGSERVSRQYNYRTASGSDRFLHQAQQMEGPGRYRAPF